MLSLVCHHCEHGNFFCLEGEEALKLADNDGYHAVAFSYGKSDESANQKNAEGELGSSGFHPPFAVPENLLQSLVSSFSNMPLLYEVI